MKHADGRSRLSIPYLVTISIAVIVAVALGARQVSRTSSTRMIVARNAIRPGERIDTTKLLFADVSRNAIPSGAFTDASTLIGTTATRPIGPGSAITAADVARTAPVAWLADAPPPGRVVITVSVPGTLLPVSQLQMGNQLELLAVTRDGRSRVIGRDAFFIGSMQSRAEARAPGLAGMVASSSAGAGRKPSGVIGLVLAVRPEDVSPIAQAEATGDRITFAIHGRRETLSGHLLQIDPRAAPRAKSPHRAASTEVELIAGAQRGKVSVP
ncbi:MAG: SAF domain-containing protein [Acidobacteriota bacterium]